MPEPSPQSEKSTEPFRAERDYLRAERDFYQEELSRLRSGFATEVQTRLEASGQDVRTQIEKQLGALIGRWKWLLGLLIAAAGLGGYASIPGWIDGKVEKSVDTSVTKEVDVKLKERQTLVDKAMFEAKTKLELTLRTTDEAMVRLRREVEEAATTFREKSTASVSEFEKQAEAALEDVNKHATKTKAEITERGRLVVVKDSAGETKLVETSQAKATWFGDVPENVVAIGGSSLHEYAADAPEGVMGAFSLYFQRALTESSTDVDKNGEISWREAVESADRQLNRQSASTKDLQHPVIEGKRADQAAVLVTGNSAKKSGTLRAVLVGCSKYGKSDNDPAGLNNLPGAEKDALGMANLIKMATEKQRLVTHTAAPAKLLTNDKATRKDILREMEALVADSKPEDLAMFLFSGHIVREENTKQLLPIDFDDKNFKKTTLRADEVVKTLGKCAGTVVVVIDG